MSNISDLPISPELLEILRCPLAVQSTEYGDDPGKLELVHNCWLVYSTEMYVAFGSQ